MGSWLPFAFVHAMTVKVPNKYLYHARTLLKNSADLRLPALLHYRDFPSMQALFD